MNALKHGMAATLLTPAEEEQAIEERVERWYGTIRPWDDWEVWLLRMLAVETVRLERILTEERILGDQLMRRAETMWDIDRQLAALDVAARLPVDPERVAAKLRTTLHGCDWLLGRWTDLRAWLDVKGPWDERRRALVLDLLGTPAELREADLLRLEAAPVEEQRALADEQVAALEALRAGALEERDADAREAAESGVFHDVPKALALVRRYKAECSRRIAWIRSQFREQRPGASPIFDAPRGDRSERPPIPDAGPAPPPPPPPPPPSAGGSTEEEPRRREALLAVQARRAEAERIAAAVLNAAPASQPTIPVATPQSASLATPPPRRSRPDLRSRKRRR